MDINSNKIREIRKKLDLNQKDFAKLLGRSQNTISQWENGLRSPDFASIELIASRMNVAIEDICLEEPDINSDARPTSFRLSSSYIYDSENSRIYNKSDVKILIENSFDDTIVKKIGKSNLTKFIDDAIFIFATNKQYENNFNINNIKLYLHFLPKDLLNEASQIVYDMMTSHIKEFEKRFIKLFKVDIESYITSLLDKE